MEQGCGCKLFNGQPCYTAFSRDHFCSIRDQYSSLSHLELQNILFGHVMATIRTNKTIDHRGHQPKGRERNSTIYFHEGQKVLCDTSYTNYTITPYMFLHNIGVKKYETVKRAYIQNGLEPITHGNKFCLPKHAFTTHDIRQVSTFLSNYAETHTILLPGRILGYKRSDIQLLPTQLTKNKIWKSYIQSCGTLTFRLASYRTFCRIWQVYMPQLIITTPKTDLCWTCQSNSAAITAAANKTDQEKLQVILVILLLYNN